MQKKKISGPLNEELLDCYSPSNDSLNIHSSDIKHHLYQEPRYYFRERIKTCVCKLKFTTTEFYNYFSEMIYFLLAFIGVASAGLIGPMAAVPPVDAVPLVSFLKRIMVSTAINYNQDLGWPCLQNFQNWRPMQVRSPLGDWVEQYEYEYWWYFQSLAKIFDNLFMRLNLCFPCTVSG